MSNINGKTNINKKHIDDNENINFWDSYNESWLFLSNISVKWSINLWSMFNSSKRINARFFLRDVYWAWINNDSDYSYITNNKKNIELDIKYTEGFNETIPYFQLSCIHNVATFNFTWNRKYICNNFKLSNFYTSSSDNSQYSFNNLKIRIFELSAIDNLSNQFVFTNCHFDTLIIKNSNLGKAVFNWVTIWKLEIQNATLNDCIFNWVDFWNNYKLWEIKDINWEIDYKCMKDNYRQLKHVMDKNANHTEANEFYALEMENLMMYYYSLKLDKITSLEYLNKNAKIKWERFMLYYLFFINAFGTNIIRNLFVLYEYLLLVFVITWFCNCFYFIELDLEYIHLMSFSFIITLLWLLTYKFWHKLNQVNEWLIKMKWFYVITILVFIFLNTQSNCYFEWIKTFTYLLNPFSWLSDKSMMNLLWTEQIWMIIHKITYWILIYQLIISLKRTTKR